MAKGVRVIHDHDSKFYKDAFWDFILEHCDINTDGTLFVKFHVKDKASLDRRIRARMNGYHRDDTRKVKVKDKVVPVSLQKNKLKRKASRKNRKLAWRLRGMLADSDED